MHCKNDNKAVILLVLSKKLEDHQFSLLLEASSPADKARLLSVSAPHAASWLLVTPSPGLDLHLDPNELQISIQWWLGIDTARGSSCSLCPGLALGRLGNHATTSASLSEGAAAEEAEVRKHRANDPKCSELGWVCIPLAVETYGNWGREAQSTFSRLASHLAIITSSHKNIDDDIFELACNYKLTGKYPKDCPQNKKREQYEDKRSQSFCKMERYILTLSDQFSKWVEAVAVPTKEAHRVASALYKIFMRMGLPDVLTTDNGSEFRNKLNTAMLKKLGIRHSFITPYHPQSNGLDERYNQTLQSMLSKAVMGHKETWDEFIDSAVFAYNTSTHESTTYSPFEVMFGRKARLPVEADLRPIPSNYDSRLAHAPNTSNQMAQVAKERQEILKDVKRNILAAQAKQKQHYDAKHTRAKLFDVGVQSVHTQSLRSFLTPSLESVLIPTFQSAFAHSLQSVYATAFQSVYTTAFQSVYTTAFQSVYTTAFQSVYTTAFQSVYTTAFQSTVNN
eukprot:Em0007g792a